jgi:hypothetical protein
MEQNLFFYSFLKLLLILIFLGHFFFFLIHFFLACLYGTSHSSMLCFCFLFFVFFFFAWADGLFTYLSILYYYYIF